MFLEFRIQWEKMGLITKTPLYVARLYIMFELKFSQMSASETSHIASRTWENKKKNLRNLRFNVLLSF